VDPVQQVVFPCDFLCHFRVAVSFPDAFGDNCLSNFQEGCAMGLIDIIKRKLLVTDASAGIRLPPTKESFL
jgi:hypothetical protein